VNEVIKGVCINLMITFAIGIVITYFNFDYGIDNAFFHFLEKISVVKFFDNHSANTAVTLGLLLTAYEVIDTLFLEDDEEDETERSIHEK
jgi:hypothetical protein